MRKIAAVIIDTFADKSPTLPAIRRTLRLANVSRLYTLSDEAFYPGAEFHRIPPIRSLNEYSDIVLRVLLEVVREEHFLLIQWDGMPIAAERWDSTFLDFDYIGAPWSFERGRQVGNGGFSLRSRKLLEAAKSLGIAVNLNDPSHQPEDVLICVAHRTRLEQLGIRFAPLELAERFSFETGALPAAVFGFHSTYNFPHFLPEAELLGFADRIIRRQSNLNILLPYLDNLLKTGMHDLLRLSLAYIREKPQLLELVLREAKSRPHLEIGKALEANWPWGAGLESSRLPR